MERDAILNIILECLQETLEDLNGFDPLQKPPLNESTQLIGRKSCLSSIALVSLIVSIEERLADEHDMEITIADERAMSMEMSPFRTVESLTDYISTMIAEQN